MNASDGANPAAIECFQCRRDELAGRREEHRSICLAGHVAKIAASPCAPSSRSDLHSIESDRALIKPSNLPNGDAQKGQKGPG
jgi:hypothetical protein